MFGSGNFRPMMGELSLHAPKARSLGQAAPAPVPVVTAPTPPAPPPIAEGGLSHGTQLLIAGSVAVVGILATIFCTD